MNVSTRKLPLYLVVLVALIAFEFFYAAALPQPDSSPSRITAQQTDCTPKQRREVLRSMQRQVFEAFPRQLDSLGKAVLPDGPLARWQLPHGYVVLAGQGAVSLGSVESKYPLPQVLQYAPAGSRSDWLDFDGPDGPYSLVGWTYLAPYEKGSAPPSLPCIAASEWFVHEAGWHLMDGGMHLTPDATAEPPRPQLKVDIMFWHPQFWDIHFWSGEDGVPAISLDNPKDPGGGVKLPEGSFFYLVDGHKQPPPKPKER
jgi:hypothetical protein